MSCAAGTGGGELRATVLSSWLVALRLMDDEDAPIRELAAATAGAAMDAIRDTAAASATGDLQEQQVCAKCTRRDVCGSQPRLLLRALCTGPKLLLSSHRWSGWLNRAQHHSVASL